MKNRKHDSIDMLYLIGTAFILLWLNTGVYSVVRAYVPSIVPYFCFGVLLVGWLYTKMKYRMQWIKICLPIVVFYIVTLINYYLLGNHELSPTHILYLIITLSVGLYCFELTEPERKFILCALLLDYIIVGVNSWIILSQYPELSRFLAAGPEKMQQYKSMGLIAANAGLSLTGSYGYFNSLIYVSMVFLLGAITEKRMIVKTAYVGLTALSVLLIVKGAFTTALIMVVIGLFLIILPSKPKSRIILGSVLLMILPIVLVSGMIPGLFQSFANMEGLSDATRLRFNDIYTTLTISSRDASSIFARAELYRDSFYSFVISPIGGHMFWGDFAIGQHSTFFDYFGMYGLIAVLPVIGLRRYLKQEVLFVNSKRRDVQSAWMVFFLTSFINPVFIQNIFVALFVFVPCFLKQVQMKAHSNGCEGVLK